VTLRYLTKF